MQNKKQSCKAQSKVCPPCPKPHIGQKSLFTEQHKMQNKCSLPRGDYNLKTGVIERLLLVQNQFHLLSFNPLSFLCISSNYLSIFLRQRLKQCTLTIYYLCQYLKEANIIFLMLVAKSVIQFIASWILGRLIRLMSIDSPNKIIFDIMGTTEGTPLL